jgi:hypothetical protein
MKRKTFNVLGIDPGNTGAICLLIEESGQAPKAAWGRLPVSQTKPVTVLFQPLFNAMMAMKTNLGIDHVILERAKAMAMGAGAAFNYGRSFHAVELAVEQLGVPVTYVDPHVWTKTLLSGIDLRMKPKERSLVGLERLFPHLVSEIPKNRNGKLDEGIREALLIAEWGRRKLLNIKPKITVEDF